MTCKVKTFLITFCILISSLNAEDICFNSKHSSSILALLQASENDIKSLTRCTSIIKELESEITLRDKKIVKITNDLIRANQDLITYKKKYEDTKTLLNYSTGANIFLIVLALIPLL
jgi:hypothetical protein